MEIMNMQNTLECCPKFNPEPWDERLITWEKKAFLQNRVRSFLHIPLNFGSVMKRSMAAIEAAGAKPDEMIVLSDENSLWGADLYIAVAKDVPKAKLVTLSGTYHTKVFEGPYHNMKNWIAEMKSYVQRKGKNLQRFYFFYTTCPKCAKKYGKNFVVILAQI